MLMTAFYFGELAGINYLELSKYDVLVSTYFSFLIYTLIGFRAASMP